MIPKSHKKQIEEVLGFEIVQSQYDSLEEWLGAFRPTFYWGEAPSDQIRDHILQWCWDVWRGAWE